MVFICSHLFYVAFIEITKIPLKLHSSLRANQSPGFLLIDFVFYVVFFLSFQFTFANAFKVQTLTLWHLQHWLRLVIAYFPCCPFCGWVWREVKLLKCEQKMFQSLPGTLSSVAQLALSVTVCGCLRKDTTSQPDSLALSNFLGLDDWGTIHSSITSLGQRHSCCKY